MKKTFRYLSALLLALMLTVSLSAPALADTVRVAALKGPTGMGVAHMIAANDGIYEFQLAGAPDELTGAVISGSVDIAAVPTNLAAVLYNKTKGGVKLLALNTLGVLYVLEKGDTVHSAADLAGKTVVASGQGSTPEYVLNYILEKQGVQDVTIDWRSEHSEVTTLAASGMADIVLLPEPHVTALMTKDPAFRIALDVTEEFAAAAALNGKEGTVLSMGCFIVRTDFLENHPDAVARFMEDCAQSIAYANENVAAAAQEITDAGILASAKIAESAIPKCHMVFIAGEEMKTQVSPLFDILYAANPASVGGAVPDDNFYYIS